MSTYQLNQPATDEFLHSTLNRHTIPGYTSTLIGFMHHCWPQITVLNDCVLLQETNYPYFFSLIQSSSRSLSTIEIELNKRRLVEMLPANAPIDKNQLIEIGKQIQIMWQAKLEHAYPKDRFSVIFYEGKTGSDIENFELTFFKIRE